MPLETTAQADQRTPAELIRSLDDNPVDAQEAQDLWLKDFYILSQKKAGDIPILQQPSIASYFSGLSEDEDYTDQFTGLKTRIKDTTPMTIYRKEGVLYAESLTKTNKAEGKY